jgi:hypothetical protein
VLEFYISHSSLGPIEERPLSFGLQVRDFLFLFVSPVSKNITVRRALSFHLIDHFKLRSNRHFILKDGSRTLLKDIFPGLKLKYPKINKF